MIRNSEQLRKPKCCKTFFVFFCLIVLFFTLNASATPVTRKLQLWLDASDLTTITSAANQVSQWRDKSGNLRHANMATAGLQPFTGIYTQNELNVLEFSGHYMTVSGTTFSTTEIFAVYRTIYPYYLTTGCILCRESALYSQTYITSTNTTFLQAPLPAQFFKDGVALSAPTYSINPSHEFQIMMIRPSDSVSNRLYEINDRDGTRDRYLIAEILAYNGNLSTLERLQVYNYLTNKWATPYLTQTKSPASSARNIGLTDNLQLTFLEGVFVDNGNVNIRSMVDDSLFEAIDLSGPQVSGSGTSVVTINPNLSFANNTEYYIEFPPGKITGMVSGKQFGGVQDRYMWHFKTQIAAPEEFNPRHLSGLELWLDAADPTTMTLVGSRVAVWADKSGNERDAYQTNNGFRPDIGIVNVYGQAALYFVDRFMELYNNFFKVGTTFQVFQNEYNYFFNRSGAILGEDNYNFQPNYVFLVNQQYFSTPYPDQVIRDTTTITPVPYNIGVSDEWMILTVDPADITAKPNEIASRGSGQFAWNQIAEVITYNRTLSAAEKRQVIAYLQKKWRVGGPSHTKSPVDDAINVLTTDSLSLTFTETMDIVDTASVVIRDKTTGLVFESIPMNSGQVTGNGTTTIIINPVGTFIQGRDYQVEFPGAQLQGETTGYYFVGTPDPSSWDFHVNDPLDLSFDPTKISGCELWLDASDASTLTLSGNFVTNWADKSGKGRHAFQSNAVYQPISNLISIGGINALAFHERYMDVINNDFVTETIFQVYRSTYPFFNNRSSAVVGRATTWDSDTYSFQVGQTYFANSPFPQRVIKNSVEIPLSPFDLGKIDDWMVLVVEQAFAGSHRPIVIGSKDGLNQRSFNQIAEVVVYNRKLTVTEMQQVNNYLQNKWKIGGLNRSFSPQDGAVGVGVSDNLTITFLEAVDVINGSLTVKNLTTGLDHEVIALNSGQVTGNGTTTITINPSIDFSLDSDYAIDIPGGKIKGVVSGIDFAGVKSSETFDWKFRTTSSVAFDPRAIRGLELWFDAADISTMTLAVNDVTNWADKSGKGRHASQTIPGFRGYINTVTLNSNNVVRFYDDYMPIPSEDFKAKTIIQVFRNPYPYFWNRSGSILGRNTSYFTQSYQFQVNQPYFANAPYPEMVRKNFNSVTGVPFNLDPFNEWMVLTVRPGYKNSPRDYVINSIDDGNNRFFTDIAEIIAYNGELTNSELILLHNYLNEKWHIGGLQATRDPQDGEIDVSLTTNLTLTFTENVDLISGEFLIRRLSDASLIDNIDILTANVTGNGTNIITVDLPGALVGATDYYIELNQGAILGLSSGLTHIGFNTNSEWNFRTTNAGPFSPLDVQGIQLWYDAADLATITTTGVKVTNWADKSGYNRRAYQANTGYQCDSGVFTQNGLNILYCDRGFHFIANGTFLTGDIFAVYRSHENYFYLDSSILGRTSPDLSETFRFLSGGQSFDIPFPDELTYTNKPITQGQISSQGGIRYMTEWKNMMIHPRDDSFVRAHTLGARLTGYGLDGRYDLAEVIAYDNAVSPANRALLAKYLADKWHVGGPELVSSVPADDAVNVSTATNIQLVFDEAVDLVLGNLNLRRLSDGALIQALSLASATGNGTNTITFTPAALSSNEEYYLEMPYGQIRSENGGYAFAKFVSKDDLNFRTTDSNPVFSPEDLSGLKVWLDANDPSGLTLDANGFLQTWIDKSGHGNNFTQLTAPAQRPRVLNNRANFNNKTVVSFDDVNDGMRSNFDLRYPYTIIMVMSPETRPQGGSRLLQGRDISWLIGYYADRFAFLNEAAWVNYDPLDTATDNSAVLLSAYCDITESQFFINGNGETQNSNVRSSPGFLHLGVGGLTNEPAGNYLAELLVYDRVLSSTERIQAEAYLNIKWGLDLPIDVVNFTPPDDSSLASINGNLLIEFNKNFDIQSGTLNIRRTTNGSLLESIALNSPLVTGNGTTIMTVDPVSNLAPLTAYYINITANGIADFGSSLYPGIQNATTWNFVTASSSGKFSPRSIPGLELWLDASDYSTMTIDGSNRVSNWNDKSGYGRFANQASTALMPIANRVKRNGFNSLEFTADYLDLNFSNFTAAEIYHVFRSIFPTHNNYGAVFGSVTDSAVLRTYLLESGNTILHSNPFPTAVYVDNVLIGSPYSYAPVDQLKTMMIRPRYPFTSGRNYRVGASTTFNASIEVSDLCVYNRQLTVSERTQLNDYFKAKWFGTQFSPHDDETNIGVSDNLLITFNNNVDILTGNLRILDLETDAVFETINLNSGLVTGNGTKLITINPAGTLAANTSYYVQTDNGAFTNMIHDIVYQGLGGKQYWNFRTTNTTGSFDPRDIQGVELWFDASDIPTITQAANLISSWADKSGYSRDAIQTNPSLQPVYNQVMLNGLKIVQSYGDYMDFSQNTFPASEVFVVKRNMQNTFNQYGAVLGIRGGTGAYRTYLYETNTNYFHSNLYPDRLFQNNVEITAVPYLMTNIDQYFIESINVRYPYDPSRFYQVLASEAGYSNNQEVGEIIVYNRDLSVSERNTVYNYLFNKWIGIRPISYDPVDDSTGVSVSDNLDILFPSSVDIRTGNLRLYNSSGILIQTVNLNSASVTGNGTPLISINLPVDMLSDTDYYVEIDRNSMNDLNGNMFLGILDNTTWNFRTESTGPFDPRDLGGLQLWLDAQDLTTITADGAGLVDTWLDKSGQNRHATMTNNTFKPTTRFRELNDFNTLYFRDDYMDLANNTFVVGDVFYIVRDLAARYVRYAAPLGPTSALNGFHHRVNANRTDFFTPVPTEVWNDSRVVLGVSKDLREINDYSLILVRPSVLTSRTYQINNDPNSSSFREIAEIIAYNRVLTNSERIQVINYMNDKWRLPGLKLQAYTPGDDVPNVAVNSNLSIRFDNTVDIQNGDLTIYNLTTDSTHEVIDINSLQVTGNGTTTIAINPSVDFATDSHYCVFADNGLLIDSEGFIFGGIRSDKEWSFVTVNSTSNLTPLDVQGLELWLDSADLSTIIPAAGSNISRWNDKSGYKHFALQNTVAAQPQTGLITQNNLNVLNFPGGDYLSLDNGYQLKAVDIFEVYRSKTPDFNSTHAIFGSNEGLARTYYFNAAQKTFGAANVPRAVLKNNYPMAGPFFDLEEIDQFMQVEVQPGLEQRVDYQVNAREFVTGQSEIAEILVYNKILSDAERDIVSAYLQNKWYVGGPEILSLNPVDGAINVSLTSNLTVTFGENVFVGNGDLVIRRLADDSIYETIDINSAMVTGSGTNSIVINPSLDFNNGDSYYIEIGEYAILNDIGIGMKGFSGNSRWNFIVEEPSDITFDCRDVPGLINWFDAADNGSMTYSAGNFVSEWRDKSGYARHATQSSAPLQPDHGIVSLNGLRTLRFTGDSFDTISNGDYEAVEIYQVLKAPAAVFSNYGQALSNPTGTLSDDYRFELNTSYFYSIFYPSVYIKNYNVMPSYDLAPINTFHASLITPASLTSRPHAINNSYGTRINLDIAEICVYDRTLNGSEQQAVFRYFNHKWDISGPETLVLTPPDNGNSASLSANLVMQFNRPIDIQNGFVTIYQASNGNIFEQIDVQSGLVTGNGTTTIQINPILNFIRDTNYYVRIDKTAFNDIYGFNYYGILDNGWSFRTINPGWFDHDWTRRIEITVRASSLNSDLQDFPVYLDLSTLPASFFASVNTEGKDIRITTQDGLNALPREIVYINTGSNLGEVYFKAPYLSSVVDNVFYLYYGNPNGVEPNAASELGSQSVWSNGYVAVYHMQENPGDIGALVFDSSPSINHLQVFGSMNAGDSVAGYFGQAIDFDGSDDYLLSKNALDTSGDFSISAWLRPTSLASTRNIMSLINGNSLNFSVSAGGTASQAYGDGTSFGTSVNSAAAFVPTGAWTHLAVSRNAGGTNILSSNGNTLDTQTNLSAADGRLVLASNTGASNYFSGRLDEIRLSNRDRSNDWLRSEYLNLTNPSTFYMTTTPETLASFIGPIIISTYPLNKAKRVPNAVNLTIRFNQPVNIGVGFLRIKRYSNDTTFALINLTGPRVSGSGTSVITINPVSNFESGVDYYVEIDIGGFESLGGTKFVGITEKDTWVFRAEGGRSHEVDSDLHPD